MKGAFLILAILICVNTLSAQTNPAPARLALVSETTDAVPAVDILTATLSGNQSLQLLERDEIEKVYREQGLTAGKQDYLKLGRLLGADGLLLLNITRTSQTTNMMARLVAVKPGVILADAAFGWPMKNTTQWSESAAAYLNSYIPKLTVQSGKAIPLSVVNLRSAVNTADGVETEQQLKQLIIQRLSQEPRFFVLERQKMQLLGDEKELKADDSAFYGGSYLLEGTVDQNGYSPDKVTIDARLTPPKGDAPISMEVSGSRTNLTEVINQLAAHITDALKIKSGVEPWNASDEAGQFFNEARWALRWGAYPEAQSAAESAWALGKTDLDSASLRLQSYLAEESAKVELFQKAVAYFDSPAGYAASGKPLGGYVDEREVQADIKNNQQQHPWGLRFKETQNEAQMVKEVDYFYLAGPPDPGDIDRAIHTLELYDQFSRASRDSLPETPSDGKEATGWLGSNWYELGIAVLTEASRVLQEFNAAPEAQATALDQLSELRALTRSVAALVGQSPAVHDSYYVGDRLATHDELSGAIETPPNLFRCEVNWGCFWQEKPGDTIALYRGLMSSPVFCYIHKDFWNRSPVQPRLIAWNADDQKDIPAIWNQFTNSLATSTNLLLQMEAMALTWSDAPGDLQAKMTYDELISFIKTHREELVVNNVELFYLGWGLGYPNPELDSMDQEYWNKTIPARKTVSSFEQQRQYLADFTPYDFQTFERIFASRSYTRDQVVELEPLIVTYKSNLLEQTKSSSTFEKFKAQSNAHWIEFSYEDQIRKILNPPAPLPPPIPVAPAPKPPVAAQAMLPLAPAKAAQEIVTNVLKVGKFLAVPLDGLMRLGGLKDIAVSHRLIIVEQDWLEGKLLLSFDFSLTDSQYNEADGSALATLDPATGDWEVINCPKVSFQSRNGYPHHSTILQGELFNCDDGKIEKYDRQNQSWQVLKVSDGNNYELFAVSGHLYGADGNTIFEIANDGDSTRILASTRRQPPVSVLDTEMLGPPAIFEGPNHSLRVYTNGKLFSWTGSDWRDDGTAPRVSSLPESLPNGIYKPFGPDVFPDGVIFRDKGHLDAGYSNGTLNRGPGESYGTLRTQDTISCLPNEDEQPKLYLKGSPDWAVHYSGRPTPRDQDPKPLCTMPADLLPGPPIALRGRQLYILEDNFALQAIVNDQHQILQPNTTVGNEYDGALLCFSPDCPDPQKIYLKFEPAEQKFPAWILPARDWLLLGNSAGVWLMPAAPLDTAINTQKQWQLEQKAESDLAAKQAQAALFAKYDLNHNGVIDPDEREAALDDPVFIQLQLDVIDANHNGLLDLEELTYFDADQDKILEPKEEAGIGIALHLLAMRDLKQFDVDGDGFLTREEFFKFLQTENIRGFSPESFFLNADENRDGKIDANELESFLKGLLHRKVRPRGPGSMALMNQLQSEGGNAATMARQMFKLEVEAYWRDPASVTNWSPRMPGLPGGAFPPSGSFVPRNGTP